MKNWPRFASRIVAILSMLDTRCSILDARDSSFVVSAVRSITLAAMTSKVSTATTFAALARCIVFANVAAIRRPVKLPGPAEI